MKSKSAGIIVSGILFLVAATTWIIIAILQAAVLEGSEKFLGLWNFVMAILSIIIGIALIQHKLWSRNAGIWTAIINGISIIYSWYQSSSFFFAFFLAIYIIILILIFSNYSYFEQELDEDEPSEQNKNQTQNNDELSLLLESKQKGLLTDNEYEQKVLDVKAKIKAQPFIDKLIELKGGKLLTESEFERKRNEIINEKRSEILNENRSKIEKQEICKQRLSEIPAEIIEKLSKQNKTRLENFIEVLTPTDIIVYHDNKIKLIDEERWDGINKANQQEKFEVIYKLKQ